MNEATAKRVAKDLGVTLPPATPKRTPRKRQPNRNGPVEKTVLWASVSPATKLHALMLAGGDKRRCKPVAHDTIVVLNHPGKEPR